MIAMPSSSSKGYLPTLDGWRAVAILGVLGDHMLWGNPHLGRFRHIAIGLMGEKGVTLFLVLAGFLITLRLLEEQAMIRLGHRLAPPVTSGRVDLQEISVVQNVTALTSET
jgi:peptidoglycan/LPS O-acetylase OafA/YrhL